MSMRSNGRTTAARTGPNIIGEIQNSIQLKENEMERGRGDTVYGMSARTIWLNKMHCNKRTQIVMSNAEEDGEEIIIYLLFAVRISE